MPVAFDFPIGFEELVGFTYDLLHRYVRNRLTGFEYNPLLKGLDTPPEEFLIEALERGDKRYGPMDNPIRENMRVVVKQELRELKKDGVAVWENGSNDQLIASIMFMVSVALPELMPEVEAFKKATTTPGMFHTFRTLQVLRKKER